MRVEQKHKENSTTGAAAGKREQPESSMLQWLAKFRKALDLTTMYPDGHPSAIAAASSAYKDLESLLAVSGRVELMVVAKQLYINRRLVADAEKHVEDIAEQMRRRSIRGIAFHPGTSIEELARCLRILTLPPDDIESEGGAHAVAAARGLKKVAITDLEYSRITVEDDPFQTSEMQRILGVELCHYLSGRLRSPIGVVLGQAENLFERSTPLATTLSEAAAAASQVPGFESPNLQAMVLVRIIRGVCNLMLQQHGEWAHAKSAFSDAIVELPSPLRAATVLCAAPPVDDDMDPFERILDDLSDEHVAQLLAREAQEVDGSRYRLAILFSRLVRTVERFEKIEERLKAILSEEGLRELFDTVIEPTMLEMLVTGADEEEDDWAPSTVGTSGETAFGLPLPDDGDSVSNWEAIEALLQLALVLPDAEENAGAPGAVPAVGVQEIQQALADALKAGDLQTVLDALNFLRRQSPHNERARELLQALLTDRFAARACQAFATSDEEARATAGDVLYQLGELAIGPLGETIRVSLNMDVVRDAAIVLARIGTDATVPAFTAALAASDVKRRLAIVQGLAIEFSPCVQELVVDALADPSNEVREAAALGLGRKRHAKAVDALGQLAMGRGAAKTGSSRVAAVRALGQVGTDGAVKWLGEVLRARPLWRKKSYEQIQLMAISALEELGTEAAVNVLEDTAQHGPRNVRAASRAALQHLQSAASPVQAST